MSILFATPCYGGMLHAAHFRSCLNLKEELTRQGVPHDWLVGTNESLVTRARNEMAATFLKTKHSHLCWLDADIEYEPEHVAKLWNMNADIASGVYCMKKRDEQWFAAWINGKLVKDLDQFGGDPVEADYTGTGFLMIRREVFEKLQPTTESYEGPKGDRISAFFMTPIHNDCFESEDYHFCRKAREAGFKIMVDPTVRLKHWGQFDFGAECLPAQGK